MATFQEIRDYLETNYNQLAKLLSTRDEADFRASFENLRNDWNKNMNADIVESVTLQEMKKYPPVWNALVASHLIPDEQQADLTTMRTPPSNAATSVQPPSNRSDNHRRTTLPSQQVVDRLAIWDKRIATGKEVLTGFLGTLIVLVTLIVVIITIASVNNPAAFSSGKDLLLFMNGLVGVVLGYYFGRVPADVRADKAESETRTANRSRDQIQSAVRTVLDEASRSSDRGLNQGGINLSLAQTESLRDILRQNGD
jgi:hypothetical protein